MDRSGLAIIPGLMIMAVALCFLPVLRTLPETAPKPVRQPEPS
jgi:hypothetical protein